MKMDRQTGQALIRAAMRQRRRPGKYDLFAWKEGADVRSLAVAWKSFTKRSVAIETIDAAEGHEMPTNADQLPNGIRRHGAWYIGSFRIEKNSESGDG